LKHIKTSDVDKLFQGLKSSTKGNNSLKKGALFLIIISLWIQIFSLNFMVLVSIKYINLHEIHYQNRVEIYMTNFICYFNFQIPFQNPKTSMIFLEMQIRIRIRILLSFYGVVHEDGKRCFSESSQWHEYSLDIYTNVYESL
jgi:hypothetical protein